MGNVYLSSPMQIFHIIFQIYFPPQFFLKDINSVGRNGGGGRDRTQL